MFMLPYLSLAILRTYFCLQTGHSVDIAFLIQVGTLKYPLGISRRTTGICTSAVALPNPPDMPGSYTWLSFGCLLYRWRDFCPDSAAIFAAPTLNKFAPTPCLPSLGHIG